ncbi:tRNA lysidine(34) synthetase TilS [Fulvivirga sedimenti]|uniref:tRNA(Ile)-lysidine synthase n=1 Tax=Fulvivirga sedimenti TaxID=2879465 RepID=A0A9X1KVP7_9BACT|nr:tRNA lysidine(34) synthetase TilS [Fulvivirga sedimenti]MCA6073910.1 tRNA lysidine(34) synthetase TilS [Fulvivirga sedimenti]
MLPGSFLELFHACKIKKSDRLLVAVSGGIDSAVLIDLLAGESFDFAIAHVNFMLRGEDSEKDEQFVQKLARSRDVPFFSVQFETRTYAEEKKISIQMAARELRYAWMYELLEKEGFNYLVTAHHLNDALETTLLNLSRGTGIAGLRGIKPLHDRIFRPLLHTSRNSIESYARLKNVQWREDVSNASDHYTRNYIRHHIIPKLEELNPSVIETYRATHLRLMDAESVLLQEAAERINAYQHKQGEDIYIHRDAFRDTNLAVTEVLLAPYGLTISQNQDLLECIGRNDHSQIFITSDFRLNLDREYLIISKSPTEIIPLRIDLSDAHYEHDLGKIQAFIEPGFEPVLKGPMQASFDIERLREPLILRKWEEGDHFIPLGMKGKKKVSDLMIDEKIPLNLKQRVCVLESNGEIVWVVGLRISEMAKVTQHTTRRFNIIIDNDKSV